MSDIYARPEEKEGALSQIGKRLQAFGAGIQGRGAETIALQRAENQALSDERKQIAAQDMLQTKILLEAGRLEDAKSLAMSRIELIRQLNGDPSDTVNFLNKLNAGDIEGAYGDLALGVAMAQERGFLEQPKAQEPPEKVQIYNFLRRQGVGEQEARNRAFGQLSGDRPSAVDIEIQRYMGPPFNMSYEQATDVAYGNSRVDVNPDTGVPMLTNLRTGTSRALNVQADAQAPEMVTPRLVGNGGENSYYDLADNTGILPGLAEFWANTAGQIPRMPVNEQTVEARQDLRLAANGLIRSLSINPRFPVGEIQRLEREVAIKPGSFTSPSALRAKMRSVDKYLRTRMENELRASQDTNLPSQSRQDAAKAANDIGNFLKALGAPQVDRFETMTIDDLNSLDTSSMSDFELEAARKRYDELQR